jgi:hypothetical protein
MKTDLYTKAVLTVIAFLLLLTACQRYIDPPVAVQAEGPFAGVTVFGLGPDGYGFFDARTGDLWNYYPAHRSVLVGDRTVYPARWHYFGKVTQLGQSLVGATPPE